MSLRYYATRFASKIPSWTLLFGGGFAALITLGGEEVGVLWVERCVHVIASCLHDDIEVDCLAGLVGGVNDFD